LARSADDLIRESDGLGFDIHGQLLRQSDMRCGLPPGRYTLAVHGERGERRTRPIEVGDEAIVIPLDA
jgi:hypothetical protein